MIGKTSSEVRERAQTTYNFFLVHSLLVHSLQAFLFPKIQQ